MFILIEQHDNTIAGINPEHVASIEEYYNGSIIYMIGGKNYQVHEFPPEVARMLREEHETT